MHDHNVGWFIAVKETVLWAVVNEKAGITASFHFGVSIVKPQNVSSTPAKNSLVRLFLQVFLELVSIQNEFCGILVSAISVSVQGFGKACMIISSALRSRQCPLFSKIIYHASTTV